MKYYVIEITTYTDASKATGKGMYEYTDINLAVSAFHQKMAGAMKSEAYAAELCMVIDDSGNVIRCEKWERDGDAE